MSWGKIIRAIAWETFQDEQQRRRTGMGKAEREAKAVEEAPVVNIREITDEVRAELLEERKDTAKRKIKDKLRQIQQAERIVANHRRELEDLYAEIADGD
jgi:hypothetical protein